MPHYQEGKVGEFAVALPLDVFAVRSGTHGLQGMTLIRPGLCYLAEDTCVCRNVWCIDADDVADGRALWVRVLAACGK